MQNAEGEQEPRCRDTAAEQNTTDPSKHPARPPEREHREIYSNLQGNKRCSKASAPLQSKIGWNDHRSGRFRFQSGNH
jgi:hypothetical protein